MYVQQNNKEETIVDITKRLKAQKDQLESGKKIKVKPNPKPNLKAIKTIKPTVKKEDKFDSIYILKKRIKEMENQAIAAFNCGNGKDYDTLRGMIKVMKRDVQILELNRS